MKNPLDERLNARRMQTAAEVPETLVEQQQPQQQRMSFVVPTEFVELPSKGKFYPDGHPLKNKEYIEIKQMTAREEDILTNKNFIRKGIVIDKLIESLLLDDTIKVNSILVGDKNAIMVAARIAAYGPSYDVSVVCQECGEKNLISIDLNEIKVKDADMIMEESRGKPGLEHERLETGNIIIKLPRTGWEVECKLMDGVDERSIYTLVEMKKKGDKDAEITISEQLKFIIVKLNESDNVELICEAVDFMPAYDAKFLRDTYGKLIPTVRIEKKFSCRSCKTEQEMEVPYTQEFFWPK